MLLVTSTFIELEIMLPFIYDRQSRVFSKKWIAAYEVKIMIKILFWVINVSQ